MNPYFQNKSVTLYHGDCFDILPLFAPGSFDAAITDPPYGHNNAGGHDLISNIGRALGAKTDGHRLLHLRPIQADGPEATENFERFCKEAARLCCCCCCCCCGGGGPELP